MKFCLREIFLNIHEKKEIISNSFWLLAMRLSQLKIKDKKITCFRFGHKSFKFITIFLSWVLAKIYAHDQKLNIAQYQVMNLIDQIFSDFYQNEMIITFIQFDRIYIAFFCLRSSTTFFLSLVLCCEREQRTSKAILSYLIAMIIIIKLNESDL